MKNIWFKDKRSSIEKEIDSILECLEPMSPDTKEYGIMVEQLAKLAKAQEFEKPRGVSPDVKAMLIGNGIITLLVLSYEKANVVTSKWTSFLFKGRV
jgi:hypothetical protein